MARSRFLRPNLYRTMKIVMSDGSTYKVPAAVRLVGNTLALDRDSANHPIYQVRRAHCRPCVRAAAATAVRTPTAPPATPLAGRRRLRRLHEQARNGPHRATAQARREKDVRRRRIDARARRGGARARGGPAAGRGAPPGLQLCASRLFSPEDKWRRPARSIFVVSFIFIHLSPLR